ncbi:3244_t:CDS:1, partial [Gigaspora margarita]
IAKEKLKEYNDINLILNRIRNDIVDYEAQVANLEAQFWGSTVYEVKEVTYSCENKIKPPGRLQSFFLQQL